LGEDAHVANLIDEDKKFWNIQLLNAIFSPEEAKVIKGIPISPIQVKDFLIWRCTSNGIFSVRSAYHLEMEYNARNAGEGSRKQSKKKIWKACWNLQSPNVVKMFLWRALNNLLPTRRNLRCRGVNLDSVCPICETKEEDITHVL
jgi:hypothetical protein